MNKGEYAKSLFESGMNCAQSVFCAFSEELGFDRETALKISAGFGGGFGRLREVCGAISGMTMTLSFKFACTDPNDKDKKAALYALIQRAAGEFKAQTGTIVCRELLGLDSASEPVPETRTQSYYQKRPCSEIVCLAAEITEKYMQNTAEF